MRLRLRKHQRAIAKLAKHPRATQKRGLQREVQSASGASKEFILRKRLRVKRAAAARQAAQQWVKFGRVKVRPVSNRINVTVRSKASRRTLSPRTVIIARPSRIKISARKG